MALVPSQHDAAGLIVAQWSVDNRPSGPLLCVLIRYRIGETLLSGRPEGAAGGNCRSPAAMQRPSPLPPRPQRERAADSGRPQQHAPDDIPPLTSMRGLGASSLFDRTAVGNYDCAASETKEEATTRGSKRRRRWALRWLPPSVSPPPPPPPASVPLASSCCLADDSL